MKPHDIDWLQALNDPAWTEAELQRLKSICDEKISRLWARR